MPSGGKREGSGRKKKPLSEKILEGNPGRRPIKTLSLDNCDELTLPDPPEFLSLLNKGVDGLPNSTQIYKQTSEWLGSVNCAHLVPPNLLEEYSIAKSRWLECEATNGRLGLLVKRNDGTAGISPYVKMAIEYIKVVGVAWSKIWQIVVENSTEDYKSNNPNVDVMAMLLDSKKPKN